MTECKLFSLEHILRSCLYYLVTIYLWFPLIVIRMDKVKKTSDHNIDKDVGEGEPSFTIGGLAVRCSPYENQSREFSRDKSRYTVWLGHTTPWSEPEGPNILLRRYFLRHVYCHSIENWNKLNVLQLKNAYADVVLRDNGILFTCKEKGNHKFCT